MIVSWELSKFISLISPFVANFILACEKLSEMEWKREVEELSAKSWWKEDHCHRSRIFSGPKGKRKRIWPMGKKLVKTQRTRIWLSHCSPHKTQTTIALRSLHENSRPIRNIGKINTTHQNYNERHQLKR